MLFNLQWHILRERGMVEDTFASWRDACTVRWRAVEHCPRGNCAPPLFGTVRGHWCACEEWP